MAREDEIRLIAYNIWQEEGCCDGQDVDHWLRAEVIWEQQAGPMVAKGAKAPARPAKAASKAKQAKKKA